MQRITEKSWHLAKYLLELDGSKGFVKVPLSLRGKSGGKMVIVFRSEVEAHFAKVKVVGRVSNKARKAYKTATWAERRMRSLEKGIEKAMAIAKLRRMKGEVHVYGRGINSLMHEYRKHRSILKRALKKLGAESYLNGITVDTVVALEEGLKAVKTAAHQINYWWKSVRETAITGYVFDYILIGNFEKVIAAMEWAKNHLGMRKYKELEANVASALSYVENHLS